MKKYGHVCFQLVASASQRCVMTLHCASHNSMFCVHHTKPSCKHTKQCFKHTKITLHRSHLSELQCCTDDFPFIVSENDDCEENEPMTVHIMVSFTCAPTWSTKAWLKTTNFMCTNFRYDFPKNTIEKLEILSIHIH